MIPLLEQLNCWIEEPDELLVQEVERRVEAKRLLTHPGVGPLTALAATLILGPAGLPQAGGVRIRNHGPAWPNKWMVELSHLTERTRTGGLSRRRSKACRDEEQFEGTPLRLGWRVRDTRIFSPVPTARAVDS